MPTLQSSGAISINDINAEFALGNNLNAYRGVTWYTDAGGSGTFSSGAISMNEFYSKRKTAPGGTFSPDGSTSSGSRTLLTAYGYYSTASTSVTCTQSATWTYTRTSGSFGSANVTSGGSATSITFSMPHGNQAYRISTWNLDATSGSNTRYWTIQLETEWSACQFCCFTPDTLITMADGSLKPIGEIQSGDMILSQDAATGLNVLATVTEVITRINRPMYEFKLANGASLRASEDHPLYVQGKGWASVGGFGDYKDLGTVNVISVGDRVVDANGLSTEILSITQIDFPGEVFTLGNSRFYANGILVY